MRAILFITILLISPFSFSNISILDKADSAYQAHEYIEAINLYTQIISEQKQSASLYYNLGNAYFKNNELGKAIWAYQKAKKINPKNNDISYNLNFASSLTKDRIEQSSTGISKWVAKVFYGHDINFWSIIAFIILVTSVLAFYLYKITIPKNQRGVYLLISIISVSLFISTFTIAIAHKKHISTINSGIVIAPVTKVRTAPSTKDATAFELHEGAKFKFKQTKGDWYRIEVGKNEGWVLKEEALLY